MWISSLCDSTEKGKPDIELVDMTSRFRTINDIMEVTTKPIIFDGDTGGIAEHFVYTVRSLERMGVSAVIIEDKIGLKKNSLFGTDVEQTQDEIDHFCEKIAAGKNYYCMLPGYPKADGTVPAVMFKTIPSLLHHKEDRLYTIREYLHLMGMPNDYELPGSINSNYAKIGQNVPARTAQWIVSEALRIIESWDTIERHNNDILFVDNTKQTIR